MITRQEVEYILGPIDTFSEQFVKCSYDPNHYFYIIHQGNRRIYISEYPITPKSGLEKYVTTIFSEREGISFGFGCNELVDILRWIKGKIKI